MNELRRGWRVFLASFIGIGMGGSSLYFYSMGLFLKPLAEAFHWSRSAASLGPLVGTLGAALFAVPTGALMDRIGPIKTAVGSMVLLAVSLACLGLATQGLVSFLLITALLALTGVGTTPLSYTRLIVGHFDAMRGLALGGALVSAGLVAMLMPVLIAPFIAEHGWRDGYLALAVAVAVAIIPIVALTRGTEAAQSSARRLGPKSTEPVLATARFRFLSLVFLLSATGALGAVVHLPAMLSDAGAAPRDVGLVAGSVGLAAIVGRLVAGLMLDRVPGRLVTAGFFAVSAVGVCSLPFAGGAALLGASALGLSIGAEAGLLAYLVSRLFPQTAYGRAYGAAYSCFLVGGAIGPLLLGVVFDRTGSYGPAFILAGGCLAVASLLAVVMPDRQHLPEAFVTASALDHASS